jgi:GDP-4-dehydro-6-deoxy-D-mannose reductase
MSAKRVLITGASGFAGRWLARACVEAGDDVLGIGRTADPAAESFELLALDLRDGDGVRKLFRTRAPEVVYHLAALSSVGHSWEDPAGTMSENVASAVNMLEALRLEAPRARTVWVSTCEVYGSPSTLPISEDAPLVPANPYAVSKLAGEQLAAVYSEAHGLELVRARPFSHTGPGQQPWFVVSSLARQAAEARLAGVSPIELVTGNAATRRDFTDVRDVVIAYRLLADADGLRGQVFNVASGHSISAAEHVQLFASLLAPTRVEQVVDPARVRAHEVMDLRGDATRLREATGWEPRIPFPQTVGDMLEWWERDLESDQRLRTRRPISESSG